MSYWRMLEPEHKKPRTPSPPPEEPPKEQIWPEYDQKYGDFIGDILEPKPRGFRDLTLLENANITAYSALASRKILSDRAFITSMDNNLLATGYVGIPNNSTELSSHGWFPMQAIGSENKKVVVGICYVVSNFVVGVVSGANIIELPNFSLGALGMIVCDCCNTISQSSDEITTFCKQHGFAMCKSCSLKSSKNTQQSPDIELFTQHTGCAKTILSTTLENLTSKYGHRQFVTSLCNNNIYYVRVYSLEEEAVILTWLDVAASDTKYSSVKNKPTILIDLVASDIVEYRLSKNLTLQNFSLITPQIDGYQRYINDRYAYKGGDVNFWNKNAQKLDEHQIVEQVPLTEIFDRDGVSLIFTLCKEVGINRAKMLDDFLSESPSKFTKTIGRDAPVKRLDLAIVRLFSTWLPYRVDISLLTKYYIYDSRGIKNLVTVDLNCSRSQFESFFDTANMPNNVHDTDGTRSRVRYDFKYPIIQTHKAVSKVWFGGDIDVKNMMPTRSLMFALLGQYPSKENSETIASVIDNVSLSNRKKLLINEVLDVGFLIQPKSGDVVNIKTNMKLSVDEINALDNTTIFDVYSFPENNVHPRETLQKTLNLQTLSPVYQNVQTNPIALSNDGNSISTTVSESRFHFEELTCSAENNGALRRDRRNKNNPQKNTQSTMSTIYQIRIFDDDIMIDSNRSQHIDDIEYGGPYHAKYVIDDDIQNRYTARGDGAAITLNCLPNSITFITTKQTLSTATITFCTPPKIKMILSTFVATVGGVSEFKAGGVDNCFL